MFIAETFPFVKPRHTGTQHNVAGQTGAQRKPAKYMPAQIPCRVTLSPQVGLQKPDSASDKAIFLIGRGEEFMAIKHV